MSGAVGADTGDARPRAAGDDEVVEGAAGADEGPSPEDQQAFEAAFKAGFGSERVQQGAMVRGTIVSIQDDVVLVAFGGKSEAVMDRAELEDQKVGDEIDAVVLETGAEVRLSRKLAMGRKSAEEVRLAFQSGLPVEGKVTSRNKGGYEVRVSSLRAFCPFSQMGLTAGDDPDSVVGKTYEFQILEMSEGGRRLVISRAARVKEEAEARAADLRARLKVGDVYEGTVRSITKFGAFVDIGGIEGLVHISALSRRRVDDPSALVRTGQQVKVKLIRVEQDGKRLSLSMKELEEDPWTRAAEKYKPGDLFSGRVVRAADFGLFVEVEPGLEGLVHVSQLPPGVKLRDESVAVGATISGAVREVDAERRRLSLSLREVGRVDPWPTAGQRYAAGAVVEGIVEKTVSFGAFVEVEPGLAGLIPISEMDLPPGGDPGKSFRPGQKVVVKVLSLDPAARRMSLSVREAHAEAEKGEFRAYLSSIASTAPAGRSAFGDALLHALGQRK